MAAISGSILISKRRWNRQTVVRDRDLSGSCKGEKTCEKRAIFLKHARKDKSETKGEGGGKDLHVATRMRVRDTRDQATTPMKLFYRG